MILTLNISSIYNAEIYRIIAKGKGMIYLLQCELLGGTVFYIATIFDARLYIDISLFP
jgi:hypothetical protein